VIGTVGTFSGPGGATLSDAPRAIQSWAAATNAKGGICGHSIKVIVMDDGGDSAKAMSEVQQLVEQDRAAAIVGAFTNDTQWQGYVQQKNVPVIGGPCTIGWNGVPMLFSECPSTDSQLLSVSMLAAKTYGPGKNAGGLFCQESSTCSYAQQHWSADTRQAGNNPAYQATISITQPDFTGECIQAHNNNVSVFSVIADTATLGRVATSCSRQGFQPNYVEAGAIVNASSPSQTGLGNMLAEMAVFPFTGANTPAAGEFTAAWNRYAGGSAPGPSAAMGWASAKIFEAAAIKAGADLSSGGLLKQLYGFRNDTFGGLTVPLSYLPGQGTSDSRCTFVMQAQNGNWTAPGGGQPVCF
jgi:branched-chain amino acid transport system substrate-binding protein